MATQLTGAERQVGYECIHGSWFPLTRARWYASDTLCWPTLDSSGHVLPSTTFETSLCRRTHIWSSLKNNKSSPSHRPDNFTKPQKCHIQKLPDELLIMILEHLIPTGMTFHIFQHNRRRFYWHRSSHERKTVAREHTVVHSFGTPLLGRWLDDARQSSSELTAMALGSVCQRWKDLYTPLMYGSNAWIFEMSMDSLEPTIRGIMEDGREPASWTRHFDVYPRDMWPLTARTIKYVTDLTILITVREHYGYHELQCLAGQLRRAVAMLGSDHRLRSLAVDMRNTETWWIDNNNARQVSREPMPHRLEWTADAAGVYKMRVNQASARPDLPGGTTDVIWDSLRPLRMVRDVQLSGVGSEERAEELTAALQSTELSGS